jgi:oligosaccharide repeat unit polymerase
MFHPSRLAPFALILNLIAVYVYYFIEQSAAMAVGCCVLTVLCWLCYIHGTTPDIFHPLKMFPFLFILIYIGGSMDFLPNLRSGEIRADQWAAYSIALLGYMIGVFVTLARSKKTEKKNGIGSLDPQRFITVASALSFVTLSNIILLYLLYIAKYGSIDFNDIGRIRILIGTNNRYLNTSFYCLLYTSVSMTAVTIAIRILRGTGNWFRIVTNLLMLGIASLMTIGRGGFMRSFLLFAISIHYCGIKINYKKLTVFFLLGVTVFIVTGFIRINYSEQHPLISKMTDSGVPSIVFVLAPAIDYLQNSSTVMHDIMEIIPKSENYRYGKQLFGPLINTFSFMMDKRTDILNNELPHMFLLKMLMGGQDESETVLGIAGGLLTNFYVDGGIGAIIIGMFLMGMLAAWGYQRCHNEILSNKLLYAYILMNFLWALYASIIDGIGVILTPIAIISAVKICKNRGITNDRKICE